MQVDSSNFYCQAPNKFYSLELWDNTACVGDGPTDWITLDGVLIADPDAASQQHADRQLRLVNMKFDLACGTFSADAGKIIGTCAAADAAAIARNTRNAIEARNCSTLEKTCLFYTCQTAFSRSNSKY
jgi:hypothetical protein